MFTRLYKTSCEGSAYRIWKLNIHLAPFCWTKEWDYIRVLLRLGGSSARRGGGFGELCLLTILHDLVKPLVVDVGVDLHPEGEVVRELEAEFLSGVALIRKQLLNVCVAPVKIEGTAFVGEPFLQGGQVQDLVEPGVLEEVRPADDLVAGLEVQERVGHLKTAAGQCFEQFVAHLGDVEIAHHDKIVVLDELVLEPVVDPVGEHLQLGLAAFDAVAPACVGGDGDEIEVPGPKRTHVRRPPEGLRGEEFRLILASRGVHLRRQPIERHRAAVEQKSRAFLIAAGIVDPVRIDHVPTRPQDRQNTTQVGKIVPQLDDGYEIELTQDLRDIVNGRFRAAHLPKLADIPDRNVDRFVELGRRDLGVCNPLLEGEQPLGNLR